MGAAARRPGHSGGARGAAFGGPPSGSAKQMKTAGYAGGGEVGHLALVGWLSIQPKMTRRPRESVKDWDAMKLCEASTMPAVPSHVQFHAASQCPVLALAPKPGERVLELASAPGGKSS